MKCTREDVIKANIELHTQLANVYKTTEPHYYPENQLRVEKIIQEISIPAGNERLLDVGCGMGFIIDIAKKFFKRIDGIDVTPAMLNRVNCQSDNCAITVQVSPVEQTPFEDSTFNIVTAYAVIHHLHSLKPAFQEVFRVLKDGGVFYSDTDPNFYFWEALHKLPDNLKYSEIVQRELSAVKSKDKELEEKFGVPVQTLNTAEILKHDGGGFRPEDLESLLKEIGFKSVEIHYEWYLGQGKVIHSSEMLSANEQILQLLHEQLPLTRHLFKYLRILARK